MRHGAPGSLRQVVQAVTGPSSASSLSAADASVVGRYQAEREWLAMWASSPQCYRPMSNPAYRDEQLSRLCGPHVAAIDELVTDLRTHAGRGWMPYVAPIYGGLNARVLSILGRLPTAAASCAPAGAGPR